MSTKSALVIESVLEKKIATMDFNDWKLTFNYEGETGKAISQVQVNGNKGNTPGNMTYYYNKNQKQTNISSSGIDMIDWELLQAVYDEIVIITQEV